MLLPRLLKPRLAPLLLSSPHRLLSSPSSPWSWCALPHRAVLRVTGPQAAPFLQGLVTNDMELLEEEGRRSLYCAFLNTGGRVLFDAIISGTGGGEEYVLEVDRSLAGMVRKHLSMYKVRRSTGSDGSLP